MGYGYSKRKVDNNHSQLRDELREEFGFHNVLDTHALPKFCDLVVGYQGRTYLIEVKKSKKDKLTDDEKVINDNFDGAYLVATTSSEVIAHIYADNPPF